MSDERKKYLADYQKKLKRIPLDVSTELYARFKTAADAENQSVNGLIKFLMESYVKHKGF